MDKRRPLSFLLLMTILLAGIGVGMLVQAKVQVTLQADAEATAMVRDTARSLKSCATALNRTTGERNRLLEHLAAIESSTGPSYSGIGACSSEGGQP